MADTFDLYAIVYSMKGRQRTDIDNLKDQIIERLNSGEPQASICRWLDCKESTLYSRLDKWRVRHLKNQSRKGMKKPDCYVDINKHLVNGSLVQSSRLKAYLFREGLKSRHCEQCKRSTWEEQPIPLELDHINGQPYDNRIENLRILCPNCHALTPTYRAKNKRSVRGC